MFGPKRRIFAGKQRLHEEPFCPVVSNDTGYLDLYRNRTASAGSPLGNTGSFNPVAEHKQKRPYTHQHWW